MLLDILKINLKISSQWIHLKKNCFTLIEISAAISKRVVQLKKLSRDTIKKWQVYTIQNPETGKAKISRYRDTKENKGIAIGSFFTQSMEAL